MGGGNAAGGGSASDSSARVGSSDARPAEAGGVRQSGSLVSPQAPAQCQLGAPEERPTDRMQWRDGGGPRSQPRSRTCTRQEPPASQAGPSLRRAGARAPEVYRQLTGRKRAAGLRGAPTPETSRGRSRNRLRPQPRPDRDPLTRSPAPRARSIPATAEAAPVNNTPHPLRAGTSGVRHLTSGSAGRGVGRTKCSLPVPASRSFPGAGSSRPTTISGVLAHRASERGMRRSEQDRATRGLIRVPLLISQRWYRLRRRVDSA